MTLPFRPPPSHKATPWRHLTVYAQMARKRKTPAVPKPVVPKRRKNHRTATNPFEASRDDEEWEVEAIVRKVLPLSLTVPLSDCFCVAGVAQGRAVLRGQVEGVRC